MKRLISLGFTALILGFGLSCTPSGETQRQTVQSAPNAQPISAQSSPPDEPGKQQPKYSLLPLQTTRLKGSGVATSKKGLLVYAAPNAMLDSKGAPYTGAFDLHIREACVISDFIRYGLTTQTPKRILESGGMFEITATTPEGAALKVNPEVGLQVSAPIHTPAKSRFHRTAMQNKVEAPDWKIFNASKAANGDLVWHEAADQPYPAFSEEDVRQFSNTKQFINRLDNLRKTAHPDIETVKALQGEPLEQEKARNWSYVLPSTLRQSLGIEPEDPRFATKDLVIRPLYYIRDSLYAITSYKLNDRQTLEIEYFRTLYDGSTQTIENVFNIQDVDKAVRNYYERLACHNILLKAAEEYEAKQAKQKAIQQQMNRLGFTVRSSGWFNCDRYPATPQFTGIFSIEGVEDAELAQAQIYWTHPSSNIVIRPDITSSKNEFRFRGLQNDGKLIAWIDGKWVGAKRFRRDELQNASRHLGALQLIPADSSSIEKMILELESNALTQSPRSL